MIARIITRTKTIRRQSRQLLIKSSTKAEHLVDKYQLIKKFLILGTLTNLYFCYNSFARFSIYNEISKGITDKFNEWNQNQVRNKEMIFELMKQMQTMKDQKVKQNTQYSHQKKQQSPIVQTKVQANKQQRKSEQKQKQKGSSFFSFFKGNKDNKTSKKDQYI